MGDMGELFRDLDAYNKERKQVRLEDAKAASDLADWHKHTEYHWSRTVAGKQLNWWPSTGKWSWGLKGRRPAMFFGTRVDLLNFIRKREKPDDV
jgi:hypothetical protein